MTSIPTAAIERFFVEFDAAFPSFDGDVVAERYAEPYQACRADGSADTFDDRAATGRYFASILDRYHELGARACTHRDLESVDVGGRHVLATVTWDLLAASGESVTSWRESYLLVQEADRLLARTSIDHLRPPTR